MWAVSFWYHSITNLLNFYFVSNLIDAQIDYKLKDKILADEYIYRIWYPGLYRHEEYTSFNSSYNDNLLFKRLFQYYVSASTSQPILSLEPTTQSSPLTTKESWTSDFQIFDGVHKTN